MNLFNDFNIQNDDVITVTGGGGKTSLLFAIGRELSEKNLPHVITTTAKICIADIPEDQCLVSRDMNQVITQLKNKPEKEWIIGRELEDYQKVSGFSDDDLERLSRSLNPLVILNEGDGSKRKPYKFYADYEPIIPRTTTKIIHVIGAEVLFQKINDEYFHRSQLFEGSDTVFDERVFKRVIETFKTTQLGNRVKKTIPYILFINKADGINLEKARRMGEIGKTVFENCFIGSLKEGMVQRC